jgi:hypothetical protein
MTKIINLYKEPYDVYIGRAGKNKDGYFGNPISIGKKCIVCENIHHESGSTLDCYKIYFEERIENDPDFKYKALQLKGKTLGCFCKPKPCHGDIIVDYIENINEKN